MPILQGNIIQLFDDISTIEPSWNNNGSNDGLWNEDTKVIHEVVDVEFMVEFCLDH